MKDEQEVNSSRHSYDVAKHVHNTCEKNSKIKSGYCRNEKRIILKIKVLCLSYVVGIIEDPVWRSLCV